MAASPRELPTRASCSPSSEACSTRRCTQTQTTSSPAGRSPTTTRPASRPRPARRPSAVGRTGSAARSAACRWPTPAASAPAPPALCPRPAPARPAGDRCPGYGRTRPCRSTSCASCLEAARAERGCVSVQNRAHERPLTTCHHRPPPAAVVHVFHLAGNMVRPRVPAMLVLVDIHVVAALCPVRRWRSNEPTTPFLSTEPAARGGRVAGDSPSDPWRSPGPAGPPSRGERSTAMARLSPGSAEGDLRSLLKWALGLSVAAGCAEASPNLKGESGRDCEKERLCSWEAEGGKVV